MRRLIFVYYEAQFACVVTDDWKSDWFQFGIGVYQGCTGSTGLFNVAFNIVLDGLSTEDCTERGFRVSPDSVPFHLAGYADDLTIVSRHPDENQFMIDRAGDMLQWTGSMRMKPVKCRSFAMRRFIRDGTTQFEQVQTTAHSSFDPRLQLNGAAFKFIGDDRTPFKFLGQLIWFDLSDDVARERLAGRLGELLELVHSQPLDSWMKVWLYNFYVVSKLSWMLMIYDLPLTFVTKLEAACTRRLKEWLHIIPSCTTPILYLPRRYHGMGLQNITVFFKRLQVIRQHLLKHSSDESVRQLHEREASREPNRVRKFNAVELLHQSEQQLEQDDALNEQARGRRGLDYPSDTAGRLRATGRPLGTTAAQRSRISELIKSASDQEMLAHLRTLQMQGRWVEWDSVEAQDFGWQRMFRGQLTDDMLKFSLNAQLLTLPTMDNLRRWGYEKADRYCRAEIKAGDGHSARKCQQINPTLEHVLCGCDVALEQGRQKWRHDSVLLVLKGALIRQMAKVNSGEKKLQARLQGFVHAETDNSRRAQRYRGFEGIKYGATGLSLGDEIASARDWAVQVDLAGKDKFTYRWFPAHITETGRRPDLLLISEAQRVIICIELTVPMEENVELRHLEKFAKYNKLVPAARANGWRLSVYPVEVGSRGHVAKSMSKVLQQLHFGRSEATVIKHQLSDAARRCSYVLYLCRQQAEWVAPRLMAGGDYRREEGEDGITTVGDC
jgi:hypothetical protein